MSTSTPTTLSVVICCYTDDRLGLLRDAIASVRAQTDPVDELIIVVDYNESLLEKLQSEYPDSTVVPNEGPQGLSGARNTGVRHATGDVVAFLDDDATVAPDWSSQLMTPYSDPHVLGVGGRIIPRFEYGPPLWLPPELDWVVGCTYLGHRASIGPVRNLIGANMSLRRSVFDIVGGFRSDLGRSGANGAGCEETELCIRATAELGGAMWYEPDAVAYHFVPSTRTTPDYFRARCFGEGVSKARIAQLAGRDAGLSAERRYATTTLPHALVRELVSGVVGRRAGAFARAASIIVAVAMVTAGFLRARLTRFAPIDTSSDTFEPLLVADVNVESPTEIRPAQSSLGRRYRRAMLLLKRHGSPTAVVELPLPDEGLPREAVGEVVGSVMAEQSRRPEPITSRRRIKEQRPFVSVVVASRDRADALRVSMASLLALSYEPAELIVVDNASVTDETAKVVEEFALTDTRVRYAREERPGLARAHNRGLQLARGDIVAFTDDDVVVDERWLEAIVAAFGDDESVACVTGMIVPLEIETQSQEWIERAFGFGKGMMTRRFDLDSHRPPDPLFPFTAGAFGSGANMAFRSDALRAIGGFDPALGAGTPARGGDDLAAFYDLVSRGYALVYEPSAIVRHAHRRDYESLRKQSFDYGVGLGGYLAHVLTRQPRMALRALRLAPRGARHLVVAKSAKNVRRPATFPRELVRRERLGVLVGPFRYAQSRRVSHEDGWVFDSVADDGAASDAVVGAEP